MKFKNISNNVQSRKKTKLFFFNNDEDFYLCIYFYQRYLTSIIFIEKW